jgi:hypothetical protein
MGLMGDSTALSGHGCRDCDFVEWGDGIGDVEKGVEWGRERMAIRMAR